MALCDEGACTQTPADMENDFVPGFHSFDSLPYFSTCIILITI